MWISTPPAPTRSNLSQMSIASLQIQICTCTTYLQTSQKKTKDSVTPFVTVNLSNDQYLVAFAEKDDTEGEVFEIEQVDITPRKLDPSMITAISHRDRQDRHGDGFT